MTHRELEELYPFEFRLKFKTEEDLHLFMAQLSDGWGEAYCNIEWPQLDRDRTTTMVAIRGFSGQDGNIWD
jgi:hypothetical protein